MKKIYAALLSLLLIAFCFVCPASASTSFITFSEDFQSLSFGDDTYVACDLSYLLYDVSEDISEQYIVLSDTQKEKVKNVNVTANPDYSILYANITYRNGSSLSVDFLRNDCFEKLNYVDHDTQYYNVDFSYTGDNVITFHRASLMGEYVTVTEDELYSCDYYDITSSCEYDFDLFWGYLLLCDENYYYLDADDVIAASGSISEFSPYDFKYVKAFKISDEELINQIDNAMYGEILSTDMSDLFEENFGQSLSNGFLVIAFGILPFAAMIAAFIVAMRAKSAYKKLFSAIGITCAAELTVFVILLLILV